MNGSALLFQMKILNDLLLIIIPLEIIRTRRRKEHFALIAIFVDIPLVDVTKFMVILQDIKRSNILQISPMLTQLLIKFLIKLYLISHQS